MDKFDKYLLDNKLKYIYRFAEDLKKDFQLEIKVGSGFKNVQFYYSAEVEGKLFVHKEALKFVFTNAGTYLEDSREKQQYKFCTDQKVIKKYHKKIEKIFAYISADFNQSSFFPRLISESESFFVLEACSEDFWDPVFRIRTEDKDYLLKIFESSYGKNKYIVSPFMSELSGEIYRHKKTNELRIFDLAKLKYHKNDFFVVYFCDRRKMNNLYLLKTNFFTFKKTLLKPFEADFDTEYAQIIKF